MLTTVSTIAGASATALALYLAVHLLTIGAFVLPPHQYRQSPVATAALVCAHRQGNAAAAESSASSAGARARCAAAAATVQPELPGVDQPAVFYAAVPAASLTFAATAPISPRAP